jgi:Ca2+-binding RTX toxin-like protein
MLFETLEHRTLLSASAFLSGHHLIVNGNEASTNTIKVGYNDDGSEIDVRVDWRTSRGVAKTLLASFPVSEGINRVVIRGGQRADTITIDQTNQPFDIATRINGRKGNDTITAGDEADRINGGLGDDVIDAGDGNDTVWGAKGADNINGGDGNDVLWGGVGNDTVNGGNGNDKLGGVFGTNNLQGGDGEDTFIVRSLDRAPGNDYDAQEDILKIFANSTNEAADPDLT